MLIGILFVDTQKTDATTTDKELTVHQLLMRLLVYHFLISLSHLFLFELHMFIESFFKSNLYLYMSTNPPTNIWANSYMKHG